MANEFKIKKGLIVTGADGGTVVDIQGSQGQLFSVTDDLSGSIFAVSDISGVPILDVNSSGTVTIDGSLTGDDATFSKKLLLNSPDYNQHLVMRRGDYGYDTLITGTRVDFSPTASTLSFKFLANLQTTGTVTSPTFLGELGATSTINTGVTGTTQSAGNNSTLIATTAYADAAAAAVPIGNYLLLSAGSASPLTGILYGTSTNFTGSATYAGSMILGNGSGTGEKHLTIGNGSTDSGFRYIDLVGDTTYTDYGLRIIRGDSGADTSSQIIHRGTGDFSLQTTEAANLRFVTAGSEGMRIDSSGNVGIGTTSPNTLLDVSSANSGTTAPTVRITNTLNVGDWSGVTSDLGRFEFFTDDSSGNGPYTLGYIGIKNDRITGTPTLPSGAMVFATTTYNASGGAVERMRIDSSGNVGIGTDSPSEKLEVSGSNTLSIKLSRNNTDTAYVTTLTNNYSASLGTELKSGTYNILTHGNGTGTALNFTNGVMTFDYRNSEYMRITSTGNVGIGTTNPSEKLEVDGNIFAQKNIINGNVNSPNKNLLTQDDIKIASQNDIYGNTSRVVISPYEARYTHNGTGAMVIRLDPENALTPGDVYTFSIYYKDLIGSLSIDIVDQSTLGSYDTAVGTSSSPASGRIYGYITKPTTLPHSGYNFVDVNLSASGIVTLLNPKLEEGGVPTEFIATTDEEGIPQTTTTNNIIATGNIGIGTTSPGEKLTVSGDGRFTNGSSGTLTIKHNYGYHQPNWGIKLDGDTGTTGGYLSQYINLGGFALEQGGTYYGGGPWKTDANSTSYSSVNGSNGQIVFYTNTSLTADTEFNPSERMRIDSAGNVGIGTTNPNGKLEVNGIVKIGNVTTGLSMNGSSATEFLISGADTGGTAWNSIHIKADGNDGLFIQKDTNNVGIGTTTPAYQLDIEGSSPFLRINNTAETDAGIIFQDTADTGQSAAIKYNSSDNSLSFSNFSSSVERMRIASNGNVGIGTTTPNAKLDVQGTQGQLFSVTDDLSGDIFSVADISGVPIMNVNSDGTSYFDGNVGIGTDSPNDTLEVEGGITITSLTPAKLLLNNTKNGTWTAGEALGLIDFYGNDTSGGGAKIQSSIEVLAHDQYGAHFNMTFNLSNGAPGNSERLRITGEGRMGIGTTAPLATLHVYNPQTANGNIGFISDAAAGGTGTRNMHINLPEYGEGIRFLRTGTYNGGAMKFYSNTSQVGSVQINTSSTSFNTTSDYRAKENVVPMENSINRLKELKPCRFNFIIEPENTVDGFIAHEAQEVVPEAVTGEKDKLNYEGNPEYQGIDQSKIVPLLTAALQEAISKIEQLETRIQTLENN
jgi:hypothetical protein